MFVSLAVGDPVRKPFADADYRKEIWWFLGSRPTLGQVVFY